MSIANARRARTAICRAINATNIPKSAGANLRYWKSLLYREKPYRFTEYDCYSCMVELFENFNIPHSTLSNDELSDIGRKFFREYLPKSKW